MELIPHATRTSFRQLLMRRRLEVPPVQELVLRQNSRIQRSAYILRWRDGQRKHHMAVYYFCAGQPYLEVDSKVVPITLEEVQIYGMCKEKE